MSAQQQYCGTQWIDYEICDAIAVIDRCNEDAWIESNDPVEVRR